MSTFLTRLAANFGAANTGLSITGYTLNDATGASVSTGTGSGFSEAPSGSGTYVKNSVSIDTAWAGGTVTYTLSNGKTATGGLGGIVSGYAAGLDPGSLVLAVPANKLATDSGGHVGATDTSGAALATASTVGAIRVNTDLLSTGWTIVNGSIVFTGPAMANSGLANLSNTQARLLAQFTVNGVWDEFRSNHVIPGSFGQGVASVQGDVTGNVLGAIVTGGAAVSTVHIRLLTNGAPDVGASVWLTADAAGDQRFEGAATGADGTATFIVPSGTYYRYAYKADKIYTDNGMPIVVP